MRIRGFEIAKGFENQGINLPVRKTKKSAGYDVEAAEDCVIPAYKFGQKAKKCVDMRRYFTKRKIY